MRFLLVIFLLTSCVSYNYEELDNRLQVLDARMDFYKWEYTAEDCHLRFHICILKDHQSICQKKLERCEINTYKYYKSVRRAKGE